MRLAAVLRLDGLTRELSHDEAYSWVMFASRSYEYLASNYFVPNNHIFHSALMRLAVQVFGRSEWAMRLPAVVAGVLAVPALFFLCRAIANSGVAHVAAWFVACIPIHVSYSQTARGYTSLVLLSILSWACIWQAIGGKRRWWIAFTICGFLSAWTIPSGIFHTAALMAWAGVTVLSRRGQRDAIRLATVTSICAGLIAIAYWPLRDELSKAAQTWGLSLRDDPFALWGLLVDIVAMLLGLGSGGVIIGLAALAGVVLAARRSPSLAIGVTMIWVVPFLVALIIGVAGAPRSYLFLLPSLIVSASYFIVSAVPRSLGKLAVAGCVVALSLSVSAERMGTWKDPGYRATAEFLASSEAGDLAVLPYIMDMPLGFYARDTILRQVTEALSQHHIERLLLVTHATDARMKLDNYMLTRDDLMRSGIVFQERYFDEVFAANSVRVQWLNKKGFRTFPTGEEIWSVPEGQQHTVTARPGRPLTSDWPSIAVEASAGTPFQLNASSRFTAPRTRRCRHRISSLSCQRASHCRRSAGGGECRR